jgi:hypothetical protein
MLRSNLAAFNSEGSPSVKEFPGLKILATILIPLFFCACAVDRPPTGGPPDLSPLSVKSSLPVSGSVNTSPRTIHLDFSHYVGREELSKSIFFSPLVNDYEVSMHGKEAVIELFDPLKPNRTYTLTLRGNMKSLYGNHRLDRSWVLAFSTGSVIDQESIAGRVWTNRLTPAQNVTVMAYSLSRQNEILKAKPDYVTQTGPSGEFRFEHLAPGSYRIVAITDRNGNLQFDPGTEAFAVTANPEVETGATGLMLRFSPNDLSANALRSCRTVNNREIEITFGDPLAMRSFDLPAIRIENSASKEVLPVLGYYSPSRSSEDATVRLLTPPMDGKALYKLRFSPAGNKRSELTFSGNPRTERYPELSVTIIPANDAENVIPETIRPESGSSIELQCSLPVVASSVKAAVTLTSGDKGQEKPVPFTISRIDNRTFDIVALDGFQHGRRYRVQVNPGMIRGLAGAPAKTALVESRFTTADTEEYGEISGVGNAKAAMVIVEARRVGAASCQRVVTRPTADGRFTFQFHDLPAGEYTITGFTPSTRATTAPVIEWNGGSLTPLTPSDPFTVQTVTIRPGWTTENIRLDIPALRQLPDSEAMPTRKK